MRSGDTRIENCSVWQCCAIVTRTLTSLSVNIVSQVFHCGMLLGLTWRKTTRRKTTRPVPVVPDYSRSMGTIAAGR